VTAATTPIVREGPSHAHSARGAPPRWQVLLALCAVWVIWGSTYFAIKLTLVSLPPFGTAATRFFTAGCVLYGVLRLRGAPTPSAREWRNAAAIALLMLALANGGVVWAQGRISSSVAALGVATTPLWVALLAGFLERWPRAIEWAGLGIGFFGVFLLNWDGDLRASPAAALALLVSQVSWALGAMLNRRLTLPAGPMASAAQMIAGGTVLIVVSLLAGETLPVAPSFESLAALGYLIVFGSIVAFSAFNFLIRNVTPSLATSNAYVNPIVAVLLGVGFAGERLGVASFVAMAVILFGVALVLLTQDR
jgi:drug/metabolite transporter (DMT)-like permease